MDRKDVLISTNMSKIFMYIFKDEVVDIVRSVMSIHEASRKYLYYTDFVLDKLIELKQKFEEKNITSNIDEIINNVSSLYSELQEKINNEYSYLYSHQKNILPKLLTFNSYGMFWDMGTGKTLTSLIYMKEASKLGLKFLVLVPDNVLLKQWIYEGEKWNLIKSYEWNVIVGDKNLRKQKWLNFGNYKYNITTLPKLRQDIEFVLSSNLYDRGKKIYDGLIPQNEGLKQKFIIIVDEASKLKNRTTKVYKAVMGLRLWSKGLIALTGTPYENNLEEVYNITKLIKPHFMTYNQFERKYVVRFGKYEKKYVNIDDFIERIKGFSEIIKKNDVIELPPIKENWISLDTMVSKEFEDDFLNHYKSQSESIIGFISLMKMFDSWYGNWKYSSSEVVKNFDFNKYEATNNKIKWLYEFLNEVNDKVVVVTYYRGTFDFLGKFLERVKDELNIKQIYLMGDGKVDKFKIVKQFRESEGKNILLATSTIDYGVDLPNVDYLVNFDIHYNPARLRQRRDRIYRIGTTNKTFVYYLYGDLIENTIYDIIMKKEEVIKYLEGHQELKGEYLNNIIKEWQETLADKYGLKTIKEVKQKEEVKV